MVVGDVLGLYNRNGITLNWALQNTQLSLTTPALKAKLNTKKAVPGVTATANSGVFNGSAAVVMPAFGINFKRSISEDFANESTSTTNTRGCTATLRSVTRDWIVDCSTAVVTVPNFKYNLDSEKQVSINVVATGTKLTASGLLSTATQVVV